MARIIGKNHSENCEQIKACKHCRRIIGYFTSEITRVYCGTEFGSRSDEKNIVNFGYTYVPCPNRDCNKEIIISPYVSW